MWANIFKFLVRNDGTDDSWYGYWRDTTNESTDYWVATEDGTGDNQFNIAHDNLPDGNYTVTLNVLTKRVTVTPVS